MIYSRKFHSSPSQQRRSRCLATEVQASAITRVGAAMVRRRSVNVPRRPARSRSWASLKSRIWCARPSTWPRPGAACSWRTWCRASTGPSTTRKRSSSRRSTSAWPTSKRSPGVPGKNPRSNSCEYFLCWLLVLWFWKELAKATFCSRRTQQTELAAGDSWCLLFVNCAVNFLYSIVFSLKRVRPICACLTFVYV